MSYKCDFIGQMPFPNDNSDVSPVWSNPDYPHFYQNADATKGLEASLKRQSSKLRRADLENNLDVMATEVLHNFAIEGINLSSEKITGSLLGNMAGSERSREQSAIDLLELAIKYKDQPLSHEIIKEMHKCIYEGESAGVYVGDMKIVSRSRWGEETVHDRGVPKAYIDEAMQGFIDAYNSSKKATPLYNAVRGHIDFEGIHPFADGNGRVGRTIMNMGLMRDLGVEVPFAISRALHAHSDVYYSAFVGDDLDLTQRVKELTPLFKEAVEETYSMLEVTKLRKLALAVDMNERQKKVFDHLCTMELEGGYKGKFTNQKYRQKAKLTDLKTAQRDLADLVKKGVLAKSGRLKGTHYYLNLGKENALER